jgi:hypothetical protein
MPQQLSDESYLTGKYKQTGHKNDLTGHSSLEKVLMQASSRASHTDTNASALPVAKYLQFKPIGTFCFGAVVRSFLL